MTVRRFTLKKSERLSSRSDIDRLFGGGSRSIASYPLRLVYAIHHAESDSAEDENPTVSERQDEDVARVLFSVSKKHFKHAVDRNRIKRQMREAYRHSKHTVIDLISSQSEKSISMAFIWTSNAMLTTERVEQKMKSLLSRIEK